MGKPYVRRRAKRGEPQRFDCIKCGQSFDTKLDIKQHIVEVHPRIKNQFNAPVQIV